MGGKGRRGTKGEGEGRRRDTRPPIEISGYATGSVFFLEQGYIDIALIE